MNVQSFFQAGLLGIVYFVANILFQTLSRQLRNRQSEVYTLEQIVRAYLPDEKAAHDTRVSPLLENDLAGLPPTCIAAAELDPLYDEGTAYRDRLAAAGIPVEYVLGKAMPHGYFNMTAVLPGAKDLVNRVSAALGDGLRG